LILCFLVIFYKRIKSVSNPVYSKQDFWDTLWFCRLSDDCHPELVSGSVVNIIHWKYEILK
jgi:hypothetical protein